MQKIGLLTPYLTQDGSYTFFSQEYAETFHSSSGAKQEAEKKFIDSCRIAEKAQQQPLIKLLDICYGLGYNSAAALAKIWEINPNCQVELIALEIDERVPQTAIALNLLESWLPSVSETLTTFVQNKKIITPKLKASLIIGDARKTIQQIYRDQFQADAIFLDPFSPTKCPQLWTVEFLDLVSKYLSPTGYLVTYSCAASVRTALQMAGLLIGATESVGRRSPGTIATWSNNSLPPLSQPEIEHLQTKAAIPYRDPFLSDSDVIIRQRREQEQQASPLEATSHWKKRWEKISKKTDLLPSNP
ncbi:tRNA (5-methylaminomethyl-2-thiouridine)(34)-methyltransferase MnmD [Chroococcus sp. FPU101]|uniref:tRNA (5-methylaminomethyl-2-thiouridine)(34)-methyltransferase MnmD n=1 Tax=Chroococcus sp. FPU101 TaxID=1974212 RepID=UPI001A8F5F49|nr:MnmC family methyltransferase [Chroococcus sp. FPU101]GFE71551.1 hypothetical protein CFPU101_41610 [Chroococcus sp. FPU101]